MLYTQALTPTVAAATPVLTQVHSHTLTDAHRCPHTFGTLPRHDYFKEADLS